MSVQVSRIFAAVVVASALGLGSAVHATSVTIYGTGLDASGTALPAGSVDENYTIDPASLAFGGSGPTVFDPSQSGWVANTSASGWITSGASSSTIYSTTFNLAAFYINTVTISGQLAAAGDVAILLNGTQVGSIIAAVPTAFTSFSLDNSGGLFNSKLNTLSFQVTNDGSTDAGTLNVSLSGDGTQSVQILPHSAAPVPSTMIVWSLIAAVFSVGFARKHFAKSALVS
ncbi:MAG: hypothetical protein JSS02_18460 [Planctomycetes bacterium]|nr:hypothetical protein [Planctomycetota bacterium]